MADKRTITRTNNSIAFTNSPMVLLLAAFYGLVAVAAVVAMLTIMPSWWLAFPALIMAWLCVKAIRANRDRDVQLEFSLEGIYVKELGSFKWGNISNEEVRLRGVKRKTIELMFKHRTGDGLETEDIEWNCDALNIDHEELNGYLKEFRKKSHG